jgi:hypothetical protein
VQSENTSLAARRLSRGSEEAAIEPASHST